MNKDKKKKLSLSRRQFLKGVPLGVAGALTIAFITKGLPGVLGGRKKRQEFPEDSMFSPAKDKYTNT